MSAGLGEEGSATSLEVDGGDTSTVIGSCLYQHCAPLQRYASALKTDSGALRAHVTHIRTAPTVTCRQRRQHELTDDASAPLLTSLIEATWRRRSIVGTC